MNRKLIRIALAAAALMLSSAHADCGKDPEQLEASTVDIAVRDQRAAATVQRARDCTQDGRVAGARDERFSAAFQIGECVSQCLDCRIAESRISIPFSSAGKNRLSVSRTAEVKDRTLHDRLLNRLVPTTATVSDSGPRAAGGETVCGFGCPVFHYIAIRYN